MDVRTAKTSMVFISTPKPARFKPKRLPSIFTKSKTITMADESSKDKKQPFLVRIADRLVKDQQELDEMAVQLALGKAEAKDKFEEVKKQMRKRIRKISDKVEIEIEEGKDWAQSLQTKLSNLREKLKKDKAETPEALHQQKQEIVTGLNEVEKEMEKSGKSRFSRSFALASEKIKLQMDLLDKKWDAGKKEISEEFKEEMGKAKQKLNTISAKLKDKADDVDDRFDDFKDDVRDAYENLKRAVKSW